MSFLRLILIAAISFSVFPGCASKDPYQDPTYKLQRNLRHRNQKWDTFQNHQRMRRESRDSRYNAWFNNVME